MICVSLRFTASGVLPMRAGLSFHCIGLWTIDSSSWLEGLDSLATRVRLARAEHRRASVCVGGHAMKAAKKRTGTDKPLYGSQEEIYPLFACVEPQVASKDQGES